MFSYVLGLVCVFTYDMLKLLKKINIFLLISCCIAKVTDQHIDDKKLPDDDVIKICLATDDNYAQHAAVTIASILKNANPDDRIKIYVINSGISAENIDKLKKLSNIRDFELVFRELNPEMLKKFDLKTNMLPVSTFLRLFIPELCGDAGDRLLYLDVDIVVMDSLKELWNTDLEGNAVGVVDDFLVTYKDSHTSKVFGRTNMRYFNAGVMLLDLKKCEEFNIFERAIDFWVNNKEKVAFCDQDLLNESCYGIAKYLHPKFNKQNISLRYLNGKKYDAIKNKDEMKEAICHPVIIHFASVSKPWKFWSNTQWRSEYYKYLKFTEWRNNTSFLADLRYNIVMFFKKIYHTIYDFLHNLM